MKKNKKKSVAAVIVTYNRRFLLKKCIDSILMGKNIPDLIIIIDNGSSEETKKMLEKEYLNNSIFYYIKLKRNEGGAGGFYHGIKIAFEKGFDWIWCMDDDVEVLNNALKIYLKYTNKYQFIQARRLNDNGTIYQWLHYYNIKNGKKNKIDEALAFHNNDSIEINTACFEGAFFNNKVVEKIGLPFKDFFIGEDDTYYGLLASKYFKIAYIKEAILQRNTDKKKITILGKNFYQMSPNSIYYSIRNKFLLEKLIKKNIDYKINHKKIIYLYFLKYMLSIIFFYDEKIFLKFKKIILGVFDGLRFRV